MIKRVADRLFKWYCHPDFYPDIKGDLEELYSDHVAQGLKYAQWKYCIDVLLLFRLSLLRPLIKNSIIKDTGMLKNYFKISVRNLAKHKSYTFINVAGLALGLAAFLLINKYIQFERSYDSFFKDADVIYRVTSDQIVNGHLGTRDAMSFNPSGKVLVDEVPEIYAHSLTYNISNATIKKNETLVNEKSVKMADENFVDFFDHEVIAGDAQTMLLDPYSLVLTASKAKFYFGEENPIGKVLHLFSGFNRDFKVTGIIEDLPLNTHFKFDILLSISSIQQRLDDEGWGAFNYYTFVKIEEGVNIDDLEERLIPIKNKYMSEEGTLFFNLQPIQEIHLNTDMTFEPEANGSAKSINFLEIISIFILVLAWVNYVNLSTAKAVDRAKEVGLRKVIGALKSQLKFQFLIEAFVINFLGAILALIIAYLASPYFNEIVETDVLVSVWKDISFLKMLILFTFLGTIISGFYPAIFLSNFKIIATLKGKFRNSKKGIILRKGLVVAQFAVSLILIASTFIVIYQVQFMRNQSTGIETEHTVSFRNPSPSGSRAELVEKVLVFQEKLKSNNTIEGITTTTSIPGGLSDEIGSTSSGVKIVGKTERLDATTYIQRVDESYFGLLGIDLLHGRNFRKDFASDSSAVIVNQAFLNRYGLNADAELLNEGIQFGTSPDNEKYPIVGIIPDVNRTSLKNTVEPTCYFYSEVLQNTIIKFNQNNYKEGLAFLEETWGEFFPNSTLEYSFLDDRFDQLYKEDRRFGTVFSIFSVFALFVAILGLFGLISFMASQRKSEVGVRKVLGATESQIVMLFYKEFVALFGIASLLGVPIVYLGMNNWLNNYAYRVDFPWYMIVLSLVIIVLCTLITVGSRVLKVASMNPAKTLQCE